MEQYSEVFVGLDVAKARHAVVVAEAGRDGEVRYFGEIDADPTAVRRLVERLADCTSATKQGPPDMVFTSQHERRSA